jgi:hypothetical protein
MIALAESFAADARATPVSPVGRGTIKIVLLAALKERTGTRVALSEGCLLLVQ